MKNYVKILLMVAVAVIPWTQSTQAQDGAKPGPVEAFFCKMQSGKSMKDLVQVSERFSKWAKKNDPGYSAWILTPQFAQYMEVPQVIWLGSNTSGNDMGKGLDAWRASGGDIQEAFDSVISCGGHSVASSVEINAPDGSPGDGVVMFTQCNMAEGSDWSKAVAAHKKYSAAMRSMGAKNSNWLFFPMLGASSEVDFDYWGVATFNSYTDFFAAYEIYVNGGGWQKGMELMNGVADCSMVSPSVWDVKLVRQGDS